MTHQRISRKGLQRPDLTPMVSIAFLLMAFFMVQANMKKPQVLPVVYPDFSIDWEFSGGCDRVSLQILATSDKIYLYTGFMDPQLDSMEYNTTDLRNFLSALKKRCHDAHGKGPEYTEAGFDAIVKMSPGANYKHFVDILDDLNQCGVRNYIVVDISEAEYRLIRNPEKGLDWKRVSG